MTTILKAAVAAMAVACAASPVHAQTRVTYKSAKAGSSYYQMGVELAEAIKDGTGGDVSVTVEESQGSVQNVMEVRARGGDYVFTTPPALVGAAQDAAGAFEGKGDPAFDGIRALFPIPSLTMHFVMAGEVAGLDDLAGKTILLGKGSFGATEGEAYLDLFGLADSVEVADAELSNAVAALRNGRIDGFVTAGSWPAPNVVEAAASGPVTILSMTPDQVEATGRTALTIPAGTYAGQAEDVLTTSLPVVAYATAAMDDDTAYALTKAFWDQKAAMAGQAPWWDGVTPDMLDEVVGPVPPRRRALLRGGGDRVAVAGVVTRRA